MNNYESIKNDEGWLWTCKKYVKGNLETFCAVKEKKSDAIIKVVSTVVNPDCSDDFEAIVTIETPQRKRSFTIKGHVTEQNDFSVNYISFYNSKGLQEIKGKQVYNHTFNYLWKSI